MRRIRGQCGSFYGKYDGLEKSLSNLKRRPCRQVCRAAATADRMAI